MSCCKLKITIYGALVFCCLLADVNYQFGKGLFHLLTFNMRSVRPMNADSILVLVCVEPNIGRVENCDGTVIEHD
jgi:hypothetical protein